MADFRRDRESRGRNDRRTSSFGRDRPSRGGFGRNRDFGGRSRDRGDRERKPMVDVVCDKCGKNCQVPFKPTGDKPIYCSECYEKTGNSGRRSFSGFNQNSSSGSNSGISQEQFNELNAKLDKILGILDMIEFEDDEEGEEDSDEESDEEENSR